VSSWSNGDIPSNLGGFRLSRSKIEYLKCGFSGVEGSGEEVTMGGVAIPRVEKFKYLGSIIKQKIDIDEDINHYIRLADWGCKSGGVPLKLCVISKFL